MTQTSASIVGHRQTAHTTQTVHMSDIEYAIDINKTLMDMLLKQSSFLGAMAPPGERPPVTEEDRWKWRYDEGIRLCVQAIHDLTEKYGAYCSDY
jgi:hypothetical protein